MPAAAKTAAKKTPAKKSTPPLTRATPPPGRKIAAKPAAAKRAAAGARGGNAGNDVRHGKVPPVTWDAASDKAASEGRGLWEVIRQLLAEYARGDHDGCSPAR